MGKLLFYGIMNENQVRHVLELGADGIQVATPFVTTEECDAADAFKQAYVDARPEDIEIVTSPVGMPARAIHNPFLEKISHGKECITKCYRCLEKCNPKEAPYCITQALIRAVKGDVKVYETSIKYSAKECSILDFSQDAVDILSSKAQNVDVIFAAYDENGKLVSAHKENVTLQQGKNKLDVSGIDFTNSESISVMIWDSMASIRPFADKATINK